ncbi:hypothetical protein H257_04026 [Aphanomyces astaci]|uniref:AB hydrolase-1 domain-containing protein n=1 Tax=Aphanomyces astaci TaxID=112090 RepID=W4GU50_APHAT|nr:hypothetical protein H257_04026 [Aphanomyces astaci]ETV83255.1 hypothetical protein H257_04026 [Aphanomyces astaci]|eukprot:XP_009826685.1 hypothetical protein H257_04026 [Aphanomyces astaci]
MGLRQRFSRGVPAAMTSTKPARGSFEPPKPKTWDYYLLLALLVFPVRAIVYVAPVALVVLALDQWQWFHPTPLNPWVATPLMLYCFVEVVFTLYHHVSKTSLASPQASPPPLRKQFSHHTAPHVGLFERCMADIPDVKIFVEEWFYGTPLERLTRHDLRRWLAYVFYSDDVPTDCPKYDWTAIDAMVDQLYIRAGVREPLAGEGQLNSSNPCIRHTLDEFECAERPLIAYVVTMGMDVLAALVLAQLGFERHVVGTGCSYWYRGGSTPKMSAEDPSEDPVVFVHGIGAGLLMYIPMVLRMAAECRTRQLFLLELRYVSMQLEANVPSQDDTLGAISHMLAAHGVASAHWMGHSLGSVVCSWVCKDAPQWVSGLTLIDPVVFLLCRRDVAYNFLYREPTTGLQVIMWYFVSQELHIAHAIRRHFWWYNNILFPEELPRHCSTNEVAASIFLSSCDQIADTPAVHALLQRGVQANSPDEPHASIRVTMWEGLTHGESLLRPHYYSMALAALHT